MGRLRHHGYNFGICLMGFVRPANANAQIPIIRLLPQLNSMSHPTRACWRPFAVVPASPPLSAFRHACPAAHPSSLLSACVYVPRMGRSESLAVGEEKGNGKDEVLETGEGERRADGTRSAKAPSTNPAFSPSLFGRSILLLSLLLLTFSASLRALH